MITFNNLIPSKMVAEELAPAFIRILSSGRYIGGDEVEDFESEFAAWVGSEYCIAVGNGFDALQIALKALHIGKGQSVGVPANTCIPTWMAVYNVGAKPVPIEPDDNYLIPGDVKYNVDAIIPVHLYGHPLNANDMYNLCDRYAVIEDACQAHGSLANGKHAGTFGDLGCFSFYPTKNLGAFGDGGAIVTDSYTLAERCRDLRRYGIPGAINSCLDPLQAAFLRVKLKYLDAENTKRHGRAVLYRSFLKDCKSITLPPFDPDCKANYHQFVIKALRRDDLQEYLRSKRGIETMVHYRQLPIDMFDVPTNYQPSKSRELASQVLSLPIANATALEVERVSMAILEYYGNN